MRGFSSQTDAQQLKTECWMGSTAGFHTFFFCFTLVRRKIQPHFPPLNQCILNQKCCFPLNSMATGHQRLKKKNLLLKKSATHCPGDSQYTVNAAFPTKVAPSRAISPGCRLQLPAKSSVRHPFKFQCFLPALNARPLKAFFLLLFIVFFLHSFNLSYFGRT